MTGQTKTVAIGLGIMLLLNHGNALRPFNNSLDILCWLGYFLIVTVVVLWPKTGKDEWDRKKGNAVWADGIDFDSMDRRQSS